MYAIVPWLTTCKWQIKIICWLKGQFIINCLRMRRSLVKFVSFCEGCDQNVDRVSKNNKSCQICIRWLKMVLVSYEKYGILSINLTLHALLFRLDFATSSALLWRQLASASWKFFRRESVLQLLTASDEERLCLEESLSWLSQFFHSQFLLFIR